MDAKGCDMRRLRWIAGLVVGGLAVAVLFVPARALAKAELGRCMRARPAAATSEWRARALNTAGCRAWRLMHHPHRHHAAPHMVTVSTG